MSSRELSEGVAVWLESVKPVAFVWGVRSEQEDAEKVRPFATVVVEPGEGLHPLLKRWTVTLRGEYEPKVLDAAGEREQEDFPAAMEALCEVLAAPENFQSLRVALSARGMLLRKLVAGVSDEAVWEESARRIEMGFVLTVQIGVPAGSADAQ